MSNQGTWQVAWFFTLVVVCVVASSHANAAIVSVPGSYTIYTDPDKAAFLTAAPGLTLEDFDSSVATSFPQTCTGPFNAATNDACFVTGDIVAGVSANAIDQGGGGLMLVLPPETLNGNDIDAVGPNSTADDLSLAFSGNPNAIGLDVLSLGNSGTLSITVIGLGGTIATVNVSVATGAPSFFGIIAFQHIIGLTFAGSGIAEGIGNLRFGTVLLGIAVPEPSGSMGMGLLALGVGCAFRHRRRAPVERALRL